MSSLLYLKYYKRYRDKIYTYFMYRVNFDKETAEDLTSDVFTKALDKFDTYDKARPFQPWIYRIAHNHLVNYYKARKETVDIDAIEHTLSDNENLEQEVEQLLSLEMVQEHLQKLSPAARNMILMRYVEQLTHEEIAEVLDKKPGAVRTAISRAMGSLRKSIHTTV